MIELKGPTAAEIKKFIKEKNLIEFCLINDKKLCGYILWHDESSFHIKTEGHEELTVIKTSVMYYSRRR